MKQSLTRGIFFICLAAILGGCGYYFPHVYSGESKVLYLPEWHNRTNELGLDAQIYQSLASWFRKSKAITVTKDKAEADLILAGEVVSIDLPSVSWTGDARTSEVKVTLVVRYILKDLQTDKIMWEVPAQTWTEEYGTQGTSAFVAEDEENATKRIIEDLSEKIYLGVLEKLRRQNLKAAE